MESLFAVVDIFWVSRLGSDAVATVGLTESMLALIYAVAFGLSAGATALVARRIGEKDADGAARAAGQSLIALGVVVAALIGVAGAVARAAAAGGDGRRRRRSSRRAPATRASCSAATSPS